MRGPVVSAANHRQDISRVWIESDKRNLRRLATGLVNLVETLELMRDCVRSKPLQIEIQGGDRGMRILRMIHGRDGSATLGDSIHVINEIGRDGLARGIKVSHQERLVCRVRGLIQSNKSIAHHCAQYHISSRAGGI